MSTLNWAILGTGMIAKKLAAAINASTTSTLVAVGSRSQASADAFAKEFSIPKAYASYEAAVTDPQVQAVYISFPNDLHVPWTARCAEAGKHILCEKPYSLNFAQAMYGVEAARRAGVLLVEAFMYRFHPQTHKLVELLRNKTIGDVRVIHADFSYNAGEDWHENIRMINPMGGGGIMDVGCYPMSICRLIAGVATGKELAEPLEIKGFAKIGQRSRCDEWATATVRFPGDILANLSCGMRVGGPQNAVEILGNKGSIIIKNPWKPDGKTDKLIVNVNGLPPQELIISANAPLYTVQVDEFAKAVAAGQKQVKFPAMSLNDTFGNMKALDLWRKSVGMAFDTEKPEGMPLTALGKKLAKSPKAIMKYSRIPGLNKDISRIVMGSMIYGPDDHPFTFSMLDYFFEVGGNTIDLAHVYGGGNSEKAVGQWVRTRGIREQVVILDKGAHPPNCFPDKATLQIKESLERLGLDYIDIYCLHRDNLDIPVKEWVDVLNENVKAGRIRIFGGSNWTTARLEEANVYAAANNKQRFSCSSPNFSLALWNAPTWDGCLTASDPVSRAWYSKHQMPLFSWSSQAMGFFSGRIKPEDANHPDYWTRLGVQTWWNEANQKKLERARELAAKKGVDGVQIAMAYVLNQPFLTFALIGPRTIEETRTSLLGIDLTLTPDEVKWLNMEA